MISYSALGRKQDCYAIVVEAHGRGRLKPLLFMVVRGRTDRGEKPFSAEALRMTEEGTIALGMSRTSPVEVLVLDQRNPSKPGAYDSHSVKWVGKSYDGTTLHTANWRIYVDVETQAGSSTLVVEQGLDGTGYVRRIELTDEGHLRVHGGDVEVMAPGGGILLRSPNGRRWRLTVDDGGRLRVTPAEGK
jgi:hypothetical protein